LGEIADVLVVRPFVASGKTKFAVVKGTGFPRKGFFQAFMAAEAGNKIVGRSLQVLLDLLNGKRGKRHLLGPVAVLEAWFEVEHVSYFQAERGKNNGNKNEANHLLMEVEIDPLQHKNLPMQTLPTGYGDKCLYSPGNVCNYIVMDESDDTVYFYSRTQGTRWCHKRMRETKEECAELQRSHAAAIFEKRLGLASKKDSALKAENSQAGMRKVERPQ
jgi:hypothetical protein